MKKNLFFFPFIFLLTACECGPSISLGSFFLAEESKAFVPYTGNETLIFEDQNGAIHRLTAPKGREVFSSNLTIRELCQNGLFDVQTEYFESDREQVAFYDSLNNFIFYTDLIVRAQLIDTMGTVAIYDYLAVDGNLNSASLRTLEIVTLERENTSTQVSSQMIGDTVLYGQSFEQVYQSNPTGAATFYYNITKGVVALKVDESNYWVLREIIR
ncbi:MAG: hypothetical protein AAFW00_02815 [Bacteroidota bacterium]